jgi:Membrane-fusion protein
MKKWFLIPLLVLPLVFLTWSYLHREPKTAVAQIKEVKKFVYASGYVEPEDFVLVKSEVSGIVEAVYVKEGDKVKKGQVLAKDVCPRVGKLHKGPTGKAWLGGRTAERRFLLP